MWRGCCLNGKCGRQWRRPRQRLQHQQRRQKQLLRKHRTNGLAAVRQAIPVCHWLQEMARCWEQQCVERRAAAAQYMCRLATVLAWPRRCLLCDAAAIIGAQSCAQLKVAAPANSLALLQEDQQAPCSTLRFSLATCRVPEPIRQADLLSRAEVRRLLQPSNAGSATALCQAVDEL